MDQAKNGGRSDLGLTLDNVSQPSLLHEQQQTLSTQHALGNCGPLVPFAWDSSLSFDSFAALGCKQHCSQRRTVTEDLLFMLANKVLKQCDVC